jgi:hypothetical protein
MREGERYRRAVRRAASGAREMTARSIKLRRRELNALTMSEEVVGVRPARLARIAAPWRVGESCPVRLRSETRWGVVRRDASIRPITRVIGSDTAIGRKPP